MNKLFLAGCLFAVSLLVAVLAIYSKTWLLLIPAVIFGFPTLSAAVQFGKEEGRQTWLGRAIPENELPREIYKVVDVAKFNNQSSVAILRDQNGCVLMCGSSGSAGSFVHFSVQGSGNDRFFVPK
ncbi:MAG: hypothetical protein A2937_00060 [Candidatus Yonathbacteria bacterium RIFCSPLOWO2_01_FULL_47_33b]|uniref:Uncharacterized protein n=1 Tax=Candidatus Yonathbacteria bacterium RIFCSPLOWO2_01_FULL_47_33b TaxID=1802727 RepID=A0A1G2SFQ7_9BACT|nr:MAG: hypothetical protein A2937_00060 [Candidatus Yonathbacteria bacterium RIFCSPLOWO2_01_FULL_47_33b]